MPNGGSACEDERGVAGGEAEKGSPYGYVHSTDAGSAMDGPGLRFLVFLAGCAFRCVYCHNPDTWKTHASQRRSLDDLVAEIGKYAPWLKRVGGVTISGGEPLQQPQFVEALLREVKVRWGLHTAIETQGYLAKRLSDSWFEPLDLALLDIKHIDPDEYRRITGGFALRPTLELARRLGGLGKDIWIRHVVVPGSTDTLETAQRLADFVATIPTVRRVELLPFHQLGREKWRELGIPYAMDKVEPPDAATVESLRRPFRERGIETC
jgi:pyruvate formate lyase activating enzyme